MHTQRTRAERPPHARGCPSSAASSGVRATRPPDGIWREIAPVGQGRGRGARGRRGWAFWKAAFGGKRVRAGVSQGRASSADSRAPTPQWSPGGCCEGPPRSACQGGPQLSLGPSLAVALGVPGDRGPASPPENHAGNATTRSGSRPGVLTRRRRSNMRRFAQFRLSRFRWNAGQSGHSGHVPAVSWGGRRPAVCPSHGAGSSSLDPQSRSLAHWRCDPRSPTGC